jgi:uncharacterized surface protein with fasciclin (FAS1) repeats
MPSLYKLSLAAFAAAALIAPGAAEAGKTWGKHAHTYGETKTTTGDDSAAVATDEPIANDKPLAEVLAADADFSTLLAAVAVAKDDASAVVDDLAGEGPFTVFAPTDDAFKTFLDENDITAEDVLADPVALKAILAKHVVAGTAVTAGEALAMDLPVTLDALDGSELVVDTNDEGAFSHWSPYDSVGVVNADPKGLFPAHLSAHPHPSVSIFALDAFQLQLTHPERRRRRHDQRERRREARSHGVERRDPRHRRRHRVGRTGPRVKDASDAMSDEERTRRCLGLFCFYAATPRQKVCEMMIHFRF